MSAVRAAPEDLVGVLKAGRDETGPPILADLATSLSRSWLCGPRVHPHRHFADFCTIIAIRTCPCHPGRPGIGIGRTMAWRRRAELSNSADSLDSLRRERRDDACMEDGTVGCDQ